MNVETQIFFAPYLANEDEFEEMDEFSVLQKCIVDFNVSGAVIRDPVSLAGLNFGAIFVLVVVTAGKQLKAPLEGEEGYL